MKTPVDLVYRTLKKMLRGKTNATCREKIAATSVTHQFGLRNNRNLNLDSESERESYWDSLNAHLKSSWKDLALVKVGVFSDFTHFFTCNLITFEIQQIESIKRHDKKLEIMMLNFGT